MDVREESVDGGEDRLSALRPARLRRALWVIGLLVLAAIAAVAFFAYRQPDLLLNLMGLRYCG